MRRSVAKSWLVASIIAVVFVASTVAHDATQANPQSLESAANDPTASLMSFQVQDFYTGSSHGLNDASGNVLQFRAAIPFVAFGQDNIARVTLPYVTESPSGATGLSDSTLFNLVAFDRSWGRFGVGAVALLPTGNEGLSTEKWGLGPALRFVAQRRWGLAGLFNQNIFTVASDEHRPDVNISTFQPILNIPFGEGWSAGLSEMTLVYDWDVDEFTALPLGAKVSKIGGKPVQWMASAEQDFHDDDDDDGAETTFGLMTKLLLPKKIGEPFDETTRSGLLRLPLRRRNRAFCALRRTRTGRPA